MGKPNQYDVCVVGGAGHVGAPLAILVAQAGLRVLINDLSRDTMATLARGEMPFLERGGEEALREVLAAGRLGFSAERDAVRGVEYVVLTIGTPVDEFHNPELRVVT